LIKKLTVGAMTLAISMAPQVYAEHLNERDGIRGVLLVSIDGMHALDYLNCMSGGYCPHLAELGKTGVNYTRTSTSRPSDSFPGLMALVTGGTPRLVGAFYDVAYDRVLAPPLHDTGNGVFGGACIPDTPNGTTTEYEEGVDIDQSQLNGGAPGEAPTDGDWKAIDPNRLPRDPYKGCGRDCSTIPDNNGGAWTDSFQNIRCYDQLKVNAILNWIDGKAHLGGNTKAPVPNLFGMNFQAVSVGQKLIENGVKGGYKDAAGTVTDHLKAEIVFVDAAIGQMVSELRHQGLLDKTLIIVTAKHGQSPIDPNRFQKIGAGITTTPADVIAGSLPPPPAPENPNTNPALNPIGPTQDDISLLWLDRQASVAGAVQALEASGTAGIGLGQIFFGPSLETMFNAPGLPPNGDPRSPDIVVQPNVGVIYTGSHKKQAEHGGFAQDDTNVMILVSNPSLQASTVTTFVETTQVAPTILEALGLDPTSLDAVQKEGTAVLPGLTLK